MRVLYIIGFCSITAAGLLWLGRCRLLRRKTATFLAAAFLLAGSGALGAAVLPFGSLYGTTVNRLEELTGTPSAQDSSVSLSVAPSTLRSGPRIALTFDDGPYPPYTERLLDVLRAKGARATFFIVAAQAEQYPALVRRMAAEGHTVGLHAYQHRDFLRLTAEEQERDLQTGKAVLASITGREVRFWRPPHGFRDLVGMRAAQRLGLQVVNWSLMPRDWTGIDKEEIFRRVREKARDGDIVLLHDGDSPYGVASRQPTVEAAALLIDSLRAAGYDVVSLEEGNRSGL